MHHFCCLNPSKGVPNVANFCSKNLATLKCHRKNFRDRYFDELNLNLKSVCPRKIQTPTHSLKKIGPWDIILRVCTCLFWTPIFGQFPIATAKTCCGGRCMFGSGGTNLEISPTVMVWSCLVLRAEQQVMFYLTVQCVQVMFESCK